MSRQPRGSGAPGTTRQNEYFVPRDGIDREVISADVCRYLGNDALVRPGHYEDPQTGQIVQGYYITAYRNLTSAMIEDLKADSARWDTERRTQSSRNSSGVQYRMSETHQSRQHHGPTNDNPYNNQDPYARESAYDGPRYPGTGAPGYTGAAGGFSQPYGGSGGGSYGYQQHPPPQQSPQPDPRYAGGYGQPPMDRGSYATNQDGPSSYVHTGANMPPMPRGYTPTETYPPSRGMPSSVANLTQPIYASAPPPQQSYPAPTSPFNYPGQAPSMHAPEGFSRGQSNQQPPSGFPGQTQQFAEAPNPRASAPPQSASSSSTNAAKRRSDRDDDRHGSSDRHSRQPRR